MKTVTFYTVVLSVILGFGACATAKMDKELAKQIRSDERLKIVSAKAEELIQNGLNAGDSYNEIWIRDLNTFIELACKVSDTAKIREALLTFFKFQGQDGNIVDGYVPKEKARISYNYIYSDLAPEFGAHKNTVETDQESFPDTSYRQIYPCYERPFFPERSHRRENRNDPDGRCPQLLNATSLQRKIRSVVGSHHRRLGRCTTRT